MTADIRSESWLKQPKPISSIETIPPEVATSWLSRNDPRNRNKKDTAILRYALDMTAGDWHMNGETMKFDTDGVLIDGQNRLQACILAGVPFTAVVVRGLPHRAYVNIDKGVRRNLADTLKFEGVVNATTVGGATTMLWRYTEHDGDIRVEPRTPTTQQALDTLEAHPNLIEFISMAEKVRKSTTLVVSVSAPLMYITNGLDSADSDVFWERLRSGAGLAIDDPILKLRESLVNKDRARTYVTSDATVAWVFCVKAWNYYRDGTKVKVLGWRRGGADPEVFPRPL